MRKRRTGFRDNDADGERCEDQSGEGEELEHGCLDSGKRNFLRVDFIHSPRFKTSVSSIRILRPLLSSVTKVSTPVTAFRSSVRTASLWSPTNVQGRIRSSSIRLLGCLDPQKSTPVRLLTGMQEYQELIAIEPFQVWIFDASEAYPKAGFDGCSRNPERIGAGPKVVPHMKCKSISIQARFGVPQCVGYA